MAMLTDELSPLEKASGFTINEADNDVFALNITGKDYPAAVPQYNEASFLNAVQKASVKPIAPEPKVEQEPEIEESIEAEQMAADTFEVPTMEDSSIDEGEVSLDSIFDTANEEGSDILEVEPITAKAADTPPEAQPEQQQEPVDLGFDTDFLDSLKKDIAKPMVSEILAGETVAEDIITYGERTDMMEGKPKVEMDVMSGEVIVHNDIDENTEEPIDNEWLPDIFEEQEQAEEQPSSGHHSYANMAMQPIEQPQEQPQEQVSASYIEEKEKNVASTKVVANTTEQKQKNILVVIVVFLIAIIVIGGVIGYLYLDEQAKRDAKEKELLTADSTKHNEEHTEEKEEKPAEHTEEAPENTDSTKHNEEAKEEVAESTNETEQKQEIAAEPEHKKEAPEHPAVEHKEVKPPAEPAHKPEHKPAVQHQSQPKPPAHKPEPQPIHKSEPKPNAQHKLQVPANKYIPEDIYVVQIYSSRSLEDAERRLEMLNAKGLRGSISTQEIKGNIWYRVRFGSFSTYEEAVEAVSRNGFGDAWIEKVR